MVNGYRSIAEEYKLSPTIKIYIHYIANNKAWHSDINKAA